MQINTIKWPQTKKYRNIYDIKYFLWTNKLTPYRPKRAGKDHQNFKHVYWKLKEFTQLSTVNFSHLPQYWVESPFQIPQHYHSSFYMLWHMRLLLRLQLLLLLWWRCWSLWCCCCNHKTALLHHSCKWTIVRPTTLYGLMVVYTKTKTLINLYKSLKGSKRWYWSGYKRGDDTGGGSDDGGDFVMWMLCVQKRWTLVDGWRCLWQIFLKNSKIQWKSSASSYSNGATENGLGMFVICVIRVKMKCFIFSVIRCCRTNGSLPKLKLQTLECEQLCAVMTNVMWVGNLWLEYRGRKENLVSGHVSS